MTESPAFVTATTDIPSSPLADLEAARARWLASAPATHSYVFEDDCGECEPVVAHAVIWEGAWAPAGDALQIEAVFDGIAAAIEAGRSVEATYDPDLGYPSEVWIDRELRAVDGGIHWRIRDFRAGLPGDPASLEALDAAQRRWVAAGPAAYRFRTRIICDCDLQGSLWTEVVDGSIVDHEIAGDSNASLSPITIDEMLTDLRELLATGVDEDGVSITGSARFDADLGYPVWIGLDIVVDDADGELGSLPPRLVFVVSELVAIEPDSDSALATAAADLVAARARWAATGLTDYTYQLTIHDIEAAEWSDPHTVTVTAEEVVEVTRHGEPVAVGAVPAHGVDRLFDLITQWRQSGTNVDALFDHETGYPVLVVRQSTPPLVIAIDDLSES